MHRKTANTCSIHAYSSSTAAALTEAFFFPRVFFSGVGFGSFCACRSADVRAIASCPRVSTVSNTVERTRKKKRKGEKKKICHRQLRQSSLGTRPYATDSVCEMRRGRLDRSPRAGGLFSPVLYAQPSRFVQWVLVACGVPRVSPKQKGRGRGKEQRTLRRSARYPRFAKPETTPACRRPPERARTAVRAYAPLTACGDAFGLRLRITTPDPVSATCSVRAFERPEYFSECTFRRLPCTTKL
jgi:hypothetical protein